MTRASYSFYSIRSQLEIAKADDIPKNTSIAIRQNFYVDDILTGAPGEQEAEQLQTRLISTSKKGQFDLTKWTCSEPQVNLFLPPEFRKASDGFESLQHTPSKNWGLCEIRSLTFFVSE